MWVRMRPRRGFRQLHVDIGLANHAQLLRLSEQYHIVEAWEHIDSVGEAQVTVIP